MPIPLYYPFYSPPSLPTPPTPPSGATSPYTDEEIQSVVESLVRSSIRRPYDTLGVRRTDITFSDVQEAAAGVFLMYPRSPLYLLYLAGQQVRELFSSLTAAITGLKAALRVLRRRSLPVRDVSSLVNARVALFELEGVVAKGSNKDVTSLSAYKRFNSNLDRFLGAVGGNIKDNGTIVQTPEQARSSLSKLVGELEAQTVEFLRRVVLLADGLNNYNGVGLAQILAQTVIKNSRAKLDERADQMEGMSETQRLEVLREVVLDILGVKAAVRTFGSFPGVTSSNSLTGNFIGFADVDRPALGADLEMVVSTDLTLIINETKNLSSNWMDVWVDGASTGGPPSHSFFLGESIYPQIVSAIPETYTIVAGVNDTINFLIDGTTTVIHTFSVFGALTAAQVAAEFTTSLTAQGFKGETFFFPLMYEGEVTTSVLNEVSLPFGYFPDGSIVAGTSEVEFYYGTNATTTRNVTAVTVSLGHVVSFTVDGAPLLAATDNLIRVGSVRQWRVVPSNKINAVNNRRSIQVKMPTTLEQQTGMALGVYGELLGQSRGTDVDDIVTQVNDNNTVVTFEPFQDVQYTGSFTTDPSDPTLLVTAYNSAQRGWAVVISDGPNAGKYIIEATTATPGTYKLKKLLPVVTDGFSNVVTMTGTIGYNRYRVRSRNKTDASTVALKGPVSGGTVSTLQGPSVTDTYYAKFANGYKDVQEGDVLEYFGLSTVTPDLTLTVLEVFPDGVMRLDSPLPVNTAIPVDSVTTPFIRLVTGKVADFEALADTLTTLLQSTSANPTVFFRDLNRLINPLLVNKNPTDSEIGAAETRVDDLWNALSPMDVAIKGYNPTHVSQVDDLVRTFKEKGTDRGLDYLLSCEFDVFFGLSQEEMSYAGAFQKAIRDVSKNDLVVHKSNRQAKNISPLRASMESPDMEWSSVDLDRTQPMDPPVEVDQTET